MSEPLGEKSSLRRNLLAGMVSSIWQALAGLAVVPFYLKYLGIEAYGLIGIFATTQTLLQLLDMGLAPTINREVALCSASGDWAKASRLLHTLALVYWSMAVVIAAMVIAISPLVAGHWLKPGTLSQDAVMQALMLIGLVAACRWPLGLYAGAVMGAQKIATYSAIGVVMTTLGTLGTVAVLAQVSPTIHAFFLWQAAVGLTHVAIMRAAAWAALGPSLHRPNFHLDELKRVWRFSAGMSGVTLSGIVFMQLDKIILSRTLSLEDFGLYTLAGTLASGLYILLTPVFNAVFPRLSALVGRGDTAELLALYRTGTRMLMALLFPIAMTAAAYSEDLVFIWTGNHVVAAKVAPVIALLLLGTTLNGAMHFPYALQLAYGLTRLPLTINAILSLVVIPMTIFLSLRFGSVGGAAAWALMNTLYLFLGTWMTHRKLLKNIGASWLSQDIGIPMLVSATIVGIGMLLLNSTSYSPLVKLLLGSGIGLGAFFLTVALSLKQLRSRRQAPH